MIFDFLNFTFQKKNFSTNFDDLDNIERNTRFLNTMIKIDKTFKISCVVYAKNDDIIELSKEFVQIDQKSNMNVIFIELIKQLKQKLHSLNEVKFRELFMKTTNHHNTILHN